MRSHLLERAHFGSNYKTRDGRHVIVQEIIGNTVYVFSNQEDWTVDLDGKAGKEFGESYDVVEEYPNKNYQFKDEKSVLWIKDMNRLEYLGLDTMPHASMCYYDPENPDSLDLISDFYVEMGCTPAFTLQDILRLLDKKHLFPKLWMDADSWAIEVGNGRSGTKPTKYFVTDGGPLDTAFTALIWCLENKYL